MYIICKRHHCRHTNFSLYRDLGYKLSLGWYKSACARQSMLVASSLVFVIEAVCRRSKQHCRRVEGQPPNKGLCQSLLCLLRRPVTSSLFTLVHLFHNQEARTGQGAVCPIPCHQSLAGHQQQQLHVKSAQMQYDCPDVLQETQASMLKATMQPTI